MLIMIGYIVKFYLKINNMILNLNKMASFRSTICERAALHSIPAECENIN